MARLLRGAPVAQALTLSLKPRVEALRDRGVVATLAVVRVGEGASDLSYERAARRRMDAVGIATKGIALPADCSQAELTDAIDRVNGDAGIHGCLMLRPLPRTLDERAACAALDVAKDVDGVTAGSLYGMFANRQVGFSPCTAEAVMKLLDYYGVELAGAKVTVVGRSLVIGKPVSMLLLAADATPTLCHTRTKELAVTCRDADVVVVAAGHAKVVGAAAVRAGQVIVDVGTNWDEEAGTLVGDVDFDAVEPKVAAITPVPGGVGAVTTAILAKHVVEAAEGLIS